MTILFRVLFFGIFLAMLLLSGAYRRRAHQATGAIPRQREGGLAMLGRLVLVIPLLGAILLYTFAPDWLAWASLPVSDGVRWLGVALAAACLPLNFWVLRSIGANISETVLTKAEHHLVTHGPYRWVRHPLYSTGLLLILGMALIAASWLIGVLWLAAILIFRFVVIPAEERNLIAKFGAAYTHYRQNTGALFPRLI